MRKSWEVASIAICAGLYAVVGYMSYLGLFTPVIGVVRFWPSVFIPAVFAVLLGPRVGGIGAAIGIFISDMMIHGNALLSLSVGVPANFVGFYLVGCIARRLKSGGLKWVLATLGEEAVVLLLVLLATYTGILSMSVAVAYTIGICVALAFTLAYGTAIRDHSGQLLAYSTGLLAGSIIIGIGVYAFSQLFILPGGYSRLPLEAALLWTLWTYATEIPFMVALSPPVVAVAGKVLPKVNED
ncbi:MAG: hypothetical protein DRJ36_02235 [Thermoprotei archaeon]|nr:MAG: hypothetical protein DRJ36_02235 [Thermoprotei archaeon]RLF02238.1 MAG: hypothetical protein DRJ59_04155 [Thermoprotei archaeon]